MVDIADIPTAETYRAIRAVLKEQVTRTDDATKQIIIFTYSDGTQYEVSFLKGEELGSAEAAAYDDIEDAIFNLLTDRIAEYDAALVALGVTLT